MLRAIVRRAGMLPRAIPRVAATIAATSAYTASDLTAVRSVGASVRAMSGAAAPYVQFDESKQSLDSLLKAHPKAVVYFTAGYVVH